jgi:5-histidylcysteine sulfoxide synthase
MKNLYQYLIPNLDKCDRQTIKKYFISSWQLEEKLLKTIIKEETFYQKSDILRNPLIFYLGHSAVFYLNKLIAVGLLEKRINPDYEVLFEIGVDPNTPEELDVVIKDIQWPKVEAVWQYREQVYETIIDLIKKIKLDLPIHQNHPLWALIMGIEHSRIHFETSSVLLRQLPTNALKSPSDWEYAPSSGLSKENPMIEILGGKIKFGKSKNHPAFGWDSEYGDRQLEIKPFLASKYLISNGEFLKFVQAGGYQKRELWDEQSWQWKNEYQVKHPKFWIENEQGYSYRLMFDVVDLPLDFPVEVNHYEATAYCRWQGSEYRLMSEGEWNLALAQDITNNGNLSDYEQDISQIHQYNLNLQWGSPTPVNFFEHNQSHSRLQDLRGNVWQWLQDDFNPLNGFEPHFLYEDQSAPFFDSEHKMMIGGSWASNGSMTSKFYRNWFRPHFYQHAGFRIAQNSRL